MTREHSDGVIWDFEPFDLETGVLEWKGLNRGDVMMTKTTAVQARGLSRVFLVLDQTDSSFFEDIAFRYS